MLQIVVSIERKEHLVKKNRRKGREAGEVFMKKHSPQYLLKNSSPFLACSASKSRRRLNQEAPIAHLEHIDTMGYALARACSVGSGVCLKSRRRESLKRVRCMTDQGRSEVASILAQIQAEYESGRQGLTGVASGTARHDFITARMEQMGLLHQELQKLVGEQDAIALIAQSLEACPNDTSASQAPS
jgi:hypothetical protein